MKNQITIETALRELIKEAVKEVLISEQAAFHKPPPEKDEDEFLDAKASADYIGESMSSFYRRTSQNELPFYKRGKRIFCKRSELKEWLEGSRRMSRTEAQHIAENTGENHFLTSKSF